VLRQRFFRQFLLICLAVVGLVFVPAESILAKADAPEASHSMPGPRLLGSRIVSDGAHKFTLIETINAAGEYEVRVDLHEEHALLPNSHRTVLIGRGIDVPLELGSTRRVTTWFIPDALEVQAPVEFTQVDEDPWPAASDVIRAHVDTQNRWLAWVIFDAVASQISMAVAHDIDFFERIKSEEIELYDLEIRANHMEIQNPSAPEIAEARNTILHGWLSISERIRMEKMRNYWLWGAGDVVLAGVALKAVAVASRWLGVAGETISQSAIGKLVVEKLEAMSSRITGKIKTASTKLAKRMGADSTAGEVLKAAQAEAARLAVLRMTVQEKTVAMISHFEARSALLRVTMRAMAGVGRAAKEGVLQFKYIALAQATQILGEVAARPGDLFDVNPIVMTKKVLSDREFMHDVAYMTNETFWMAGVSNMFASDLKKRIAICGAIGMVDSMAMSLLIKGETDGSRVALDTSWEVLVGNLQTQIDVTALRYFEGLAKRKANPQLKLLGYVVAFVDQTVGYFAYARASYAVESAKQAKSSEKKGPSAKPASGNEAPMVNPQLKLIPVLGPM
jgi:hypothetical protein